MGSRKRKPRSKGRGHEDPCIVCGETRFTEEAHFPKPKEKGGEETILLCPTHHKLLDNGRLREVEFEAIWKSESPEEFCTVEEFIEWSGESQYPYYVDDLKRKFWFDEPRELSERLTIEEAILESSSSMLFAIEFGNSHFTVGAPHHARGGVDQLPCHPVRVSDENAGFLAMDLAKLLRARCIVASNYWLDANKTEGDYLEYVKEGGKDTFIEIHAHGGENARHEIEISCGTLRLTERSEDLAKSIMRIIDNRSIEGVDEGIWESIGSLDVSGDFSDIYFRATEACSVCHVRKAGGIPYHIEISPRFRKNKDYRVPREGKVLMRIVAEAVRQLHPTAD